MDPGGGIKGWLIEGESDRTFQLPSSRWDQSRLPVDLHGSASPFPVLLPPTLFHRCWSERCSFINILHTKLCHLPPGKPNGRTEAHQCPESTQ